MILKRVVGVFRSGGISAVLGAVVRRLRMPYARTFAAAREVVTGKRGIEIGGPSAIFARGGLLPVYPLAERVDNVNFASATLWEGAIREGDSFVFHPGKAPGRQFIAEGADLKGVPTGAYDFVLSSHTLEHTADPLRALAGWKVLLRPGGTLILIVPHRDGTFDHRRPVTTLAHLREDHAQQMGEDDLTHLPEILELHDLARDPGVTDAAAFRARALRNAEVRSLHHHVFDSRLAVEVVTEAGLVPVSVEPLEPYHIIVLAEAPRTDAPSAPLAPAELDEVLRTSPFPTDRP
ncbi:MAG TPA: methyltransferase domain-containing protein [Gemmatimonadales bacterium]|nr:methyltransferase domain-containing protein [Gemmatimonadales bacterium]